MEDLGEETERLRKEVEYLREMLEKLLTGFGASADVWRQ